MNNVKVIYAAREERRMIQETQQQTQLDEAIDRTLRRVWVEDARGGRWEAKDDE